MTERQFNEITAWQLETFGPTTPRARLMHLLEEIHELDAAMLKDQSPHTTKNFMDVQMEFADCFFLLFGAAAAKGFSYRNICEFIEHKFEINKSRQWGEPNEQGVVKHIKTEGHENEF
jgi:hypothetical protein